MKPCDSHVSPPRSVRPAHSSISASRVGCRFFSSALMRAGMHRISAILRRSLCRSRFSTGSLASRSANFLGGTCESRMTHNLESGVMVPTHGCTGGLRYTLSCSRGGARPGRDSAYAQATNGTKPLNYTFHPGNYFRSAKAVAASSRCDLRRSAFCRALSHASAVVTSGNRSWSGICSNPDHPRILDYRR